MLPAKNAAKLSEVRPHKRETIIHRVWSNLSLTRQGTAILTIPLTCLAITIAAWIGTRENEEYHYQRVVHTQEVLQISDQLLSTLVNAETGIRGYGLTEEKKFLVPYHQALPEIEPILRDLNQSVQDNPQQRQRVGELKAFVDREKGILAKTLDQTEDDLRFAPQSPRLRVLIEQGKDQMDAIRRSLQDFKMAEQDLLAERRGRLSQVRLFSDILLALTGAISLLGFAAAQSLYRQTEKQILNREAELAETNRILAMANLALSERNKELDQFTYVVSHDLKAPLRAIANLSEWIEEDLEDILPDENRHQMNLLRQRVHRMEALINGLLQFSRAGRHPSIPDTVNVGQLLTDVIDSLSPPPEFKIAIQGEMPTLHTDILLLQQVFSNLLSNAIKHHHQSEGRIDITVEEKPSFYEFTVSDDGPGIDAAYHDKIFEIFQVLNSRDTQENTGIGLSIVKKIIDAQGGAIQLESELDQGTTFRFTWPKAK